MRIFRGFPGALLVDPYGVVQPLCAREAPTVLTFRGKCWFQSFWCYTPSP